MIGETPPPRLSQNPASYVTVGDLLTFAEWMRSLNNDAKEEMRDELGAAVDRMTDSMNETRSVLRDFTMTHLQEHEAAKHDRTEAQARIEAFMAAAEVERAVKGRLLGIFRFGVDVLGRNWKLIATIGLALLGLTGHITIAVGAN